MLRVRGNGYTLLSNKLKIKPPLNFNINSFLLYSQANDSMSVYILSRYAREVLSVELNKKSSDLEIVSISPDTIFFSFTRTRVKTVPIHVTIKDEGYLFAKQHMLNGPITSLPDSIEIIGPATIIDTIDAIYTRSIQPTELTDTLRKKISLNKLDQVQMSLEKVVVVIPVDKFTEIGYSIPIMTKHVPDSINMKLFPRNIQVNFNISHSYIPKASDTDFRPYVDFRDLTNNKDGSIKRISVRLDSVPTYANNHRIYPSSVEFINELNNVNSRNNRGNR
jgi:hypothetical protein